MDKNNDKNPSPEKRKNLSADDLLKKLQTDIKQNPVQSKTQVKPVEQKVQIKEPASVKQETVSPDDVSPDAALNAPDVKDKNSDEATLSSRGLRRVYKYRRTKRSEFNNQRMQQRSEMHLDRYSGFAERSGDNGRTDENSSSGELDETDVGLMIAFGMDKELAQKLGADKASQIEADIDKNAEQIDDNPQESNKPVKTEFEFTSAAQAKSIFQQYKTEYHKLLWRLLSCGILVVITFIYENIGIFGGALPSAINPEYYPVMHVLIGLQLLLLCAALIYKQLYNGMMGLFSLKPIPESMTFAVMSVTFIYHIAMCFVRGSGQVKIHNFPIALCVLLTLSYEFMNLKREIFSFNISSSKRMKHSIERLDPRDAELENEIFYDSLPENPTMFKIRKASFIDNFFKRSNEYYPNKSIINAIIPAITALGLIFAVVGSFITKDVGTGISAGYMMFVIGMPFSLLVTYSYPFYKASHDAYAMGSAIIGEVSLNEYSTASAISFDDRDVFPSNGVKIKSVSVFGEKYLIDKILLFAAKVFALTGGPLSDVLEVAVRDFDQSSDKAELIEISDDGIEAMVGADHIYIGKASYLNGKGYVPVSSGEDNNIENGSDVNILYMVCNDEVSAKMYIRYIIDPDFESILKQLYRAGMCIGIKTFDPNINDRMMSSRISLSKYPVKILRCKDINTQSGVASNVDSGIISKTSTKSLLQALALCDKVTHVIKMNMIVKFVAIFVSIIIMSLVLMLNMTGEMCSFHIALYQVFWIVPVWLIAKLMI